MSPFEIIGRLCRVVEDLAEIVEKQQTIIEQSKIEESVKKEFRARIEQSEHEINQIGRDHRKQGAIK